MPMELPKDYELLNAALCVHSSSRLGEITNTHLSVLGVGGGGDKRGREQS